MSLPLYYLHSVVLFNTAMVALAVYLVPSSTTRTSATDMFITPPTDKLTTILQLVVQQIHYIAMPEPNIRHDKILECGKFLSVGGAIVVQQVVELL